MNQRLRRTGAASDSGVALVAAIAVAIIGMAFSLIVVSQAISITNDAARDRVRTVEIHAAEAALDAAFRTIESDTPCESELTVGEGSDSVVVTVHYQYLDANGEEILCSSGILAGDPVTAVLTSDALPASELPAAQAPERHMQARVNMVPISEPSMGVAIFSAGAFNAANSGQVLPLDPNEPARVWIDSGDFNCSNSYTVDADVIVPDGGFNMSNTCKVTGSMWVRDSSSASGNVSPFRIGGDVVVFNGNLSADKQKFGGEVSTGGNIWGIGSTVGTICSDGTSDGYAPCPALPEYTQRGLPVVDYVPADWEAMGFVEKSSSTFGQEVASGAGLTGSTYDTVADNPCSLSGSQIKNPIVMSSEKSLYDLRSCSTFSTNNQLTLVIMEDTAIFAGGFAFSNKFAVISGDGEQHDVWFIVPTGAAGTLNVSMSNSDTIVEPIHLFVYTPGSVNLTNNTELVGQAYGDEINTSNSFKLKYTGMGIPGVELGDPTSSSSTAGFTIEIVNKHEISN